MCGLRRVENLIDVDTIRINEIAVEGFAPKPVELFVAPGAPCKMGLDDLGVEVLKVKFIRYNKKGGPALDDQSQ